MAQRRTPDDDGRVTIKTGTGVNIVMLIFACAGDRDAIARPYVMLQCHADQCRDGDPPPNSARAVRLQQRYSPAAGNGAVQRTPDEAIGLHLGPDPARVAPATLPPVGWRHAPVNPKSAGRSGHEPDPPEPRFDVRKVLLGFQEPPLWWSHPETWRRRDWVVSDLAIAQAEVLAAPTDRDGALREVTAWFREQLKTIHQNVRGKHKKMVTLIEERKRRLGLVGAGDAGSAGPDDETAAVLRNLGYSPGAVIPVGAMLPPGYEHDDRDRESRIADMRRLEREAAMAAPLSSRVVFTREMMVEQLGPTYALLWPWPASDNETQAGVLHYTILRMLDWTPDDKPATAMALAFDAAGWSRAPYARSFEDRRHFANWIAQRARMYAKSLGRCRALIPAMRDDIPVLFREKTSKVTLSGKKMKVAVPALLSDRGLATDPTIDVWDSIANSKPVRGDRFAGLPSRTTGRAVPANRRVSPSKPVTTDGGEVAGRQMLAERYGENIPLWQLKMIDRALDDMEQERQHRQARDVAVDGRPTPDVAIHGFERNDGSDTHGTVGHSSSGTRKARGAAAAEATVEQVHNEITFHEWLDTLDVGDDCETIRVIALTLHHWGSGEPHEDLARMIGLDPEAVRGRLALAFEGLRRAIGYEPSRRGRVEDGIKKLAIRAETLENIATQMTFEAEILAPTKNGGRPRKLDTKVAAERMSQAAQLLEVLELDERLFLLLDGVAVAPSEMFAQRPRGFHEVSGPSLQLLAERIAEYACAASALDPATGFRPATIASPAVSGTLSKPSIWEVLDALGDAGLLKDRAFRGRPGGAARLAVSLAGAMAYRGVDVEKLLQEYIDREPRPPALAKPIPASDRPGSAPIDEIAIRRHAADLRALPWRLPSWHASEPGVVGLGASDRESRYLIHDWRFAPPVPAVAP